MHHFISCIEYKKLFLWKLKNVQQWNHYTMRNCNTVITLVYTLHSMYIFNVIAEYKEWCWFYQIVMSVQKSNIMKNKLQSWFLLNLVFIPGCSSRHILRARHGSFDHKLPLTRSNSMFENRYSFLSPVLCKCPFMYEHKHVLMQSVA